MSRLPLSLAVEDLSAYCRALGRQLGESSPGHLKLMNMLARAGGYQNLQHMRALQAAEARSRRREQVASGAQAVQAQADHRLLERCLNQFDGQGQLLRWPSRRAVQTLALFSLWAELPAGQEMAERQVNAQLNRLHLFDDPATLRRTMISCGLLTRRRDGSGYRRVEQAPPAEAQLLIRALRRRRASTPPPGQAEAQGAGQPAS
ncbi:DUF2087 domain-containing protein [Nocardioides marinus]|nr:DUF2087 domain-containing protein [Nocardioides marinus]